jgi:hypothetical protein
LAYSGKKSGFRVSSWLKGDRIGKVEIFNPVSMAAFLALVIELVI